MRRLLLAIALLLVPTAVLALSFTRNEVRVEDARVCIYKNGSEPSLSLSFKTYDADGEVVRDIAGRNVWPLLTATQKTQIRNIIGAVSDAIYSQEAIPTPTPTP